MLMCAGSCRLAGNADGHVFCSCGRGVLQGTGSVPAERFRLPACNPGVQDGDVHLRRKRQYGTITYTYDAENRLLKTCGSGGVGVEYAYDNNGNLLSQTSSLKHSIYEYNPQNRMVRSRVVDD